MSRQRTKRRVGKIVSPIVIAVLKIHTAITGTQRSRIIVTNESGKILLVKGFIGVSWSLPGGGIEKGETPIDAAVRELYEETGLRIRPTYVRLAGVLEGTQSPVNYVAHIFTATVSRSDLPSEPHRSREIIEIGWFDVGNLPDDISTIVRPSLGLVSKYRGI